MHHFHAVEEANRLSFQRFIARYCAGMQTGAVGKVAGATILVETSRHRTNVPADASACRYIITHPEMSWSIVARSVWRNGQLHMPAATHTVIERYDDLDGRYGDFPECAVNLWFRRLDL